VSLLTSLLTFSIYFLYAVSYPPPSYFPTYTLGAMMAVQIFEHAKTKVPNLEESLSKGEFAPLRLWLNEHLHRWVYHNYVLYMYVCLYILVYLYTYVYLNILLCLCFLSIKPPPPTFNLHRRGSLDASADDLMLAVTGMHCVYDCTHRSPFFYTS
jgi:hypothetical protein